jgi:hypothetical protein
VFRRVVFLDAARCVHPLWARVAPTTHFPHLDPGRIDGTGALAQIAFRARQEPG